MTPHPAARRLARTVLSPLLAAAAQAACARSAGVDRPQLAREAHALGWLLGVLGAALGADLLFDRREREGLALLAECVERAVGDGRRLEPAAGTLPPLVGIATARQHEPALALGVVLEAHLRALPRGATLRWSYRSGRGWVAFAFHGPRLCAPEQARLCECLGATPGVSYEARSSTLTLGHLAVATVGGS